MTPWVVKNLTVFPCMHTLIRQPVLSQATIKAICTLHELMPIRFADSMIVLGVWRNNVACNKEHMSIALRMPGHLFELLPDDG